MLPGVNADSKPNIPLAGQPEERGFLQGREIHQHTSKTSQLMPLPRRCLDLAAWSWIALGGVIQREAMKSSPPKLHILAAVTTSVGIGLSLQSRSQGESERFDSYHRPSAYVGPYPLPLGWPSKNFLPTGSTKEGN